MRSAKPACPREAGVDLSQSGDEGAGIGLPVRQYVPGVRMAEQPAREVATLGRLGHEVPHPGGECPVVALDVVRRVAQIGHARVELVDDPGQHRVVVGADL